MKDKEKYREAVLEARNYLFMNGVEYAEAVQRGDERAADLRQLCKTRIWKQLDEVAEFLKEDKE